ncbi:hypothetical protein ACWEPI_26860 [Streptomyces sp. NPDC004262]
MTTDTDLPALIPTHAAPGCLDADDIHVRWVMPEIFHDLPVREADDDEAVRLLEDLADRALPGAGEEDRTRSALICALSTGDLMAAGVDYASICVTAVVESLCTATVFVSLTDSPEATGGVRGTAKALAAGLRRTGTDEVSDIELPCGPAVSSVGTRETELTGDLTGDGAPETFPTWHIRAGTRPALTDPDLVAVASAFAEAVPSDPGREGAPTSVQAVYREGDPSERLDRARRMGIHRPQGIGDRAARPR